MAKYDRFVSLRDTTPFDTEAAHNKLYRENTSELGKGLRSGVASTGGQLRALAGNVGEALGADEFAAAQYAQSRAAQEEAARLAPEITSYKEVGKHRGLLRDSFDYVTGLAGQSVPYIGASIAGGLLTRGKGLKAMAGATAATTPLEAGNAVQRQQNDPEALQRSAGERLAVAAGTGAVSSALQNIVPLAVTGQLARSTVGRAVGNEITEGVVGQRAAQAVGRTTPGIIAKNAALGVGGESLAEGGAALVHQASHSYLNPNRDTSGDLDEVKEGLVGGAAVGGPLAAVGAGRELINNRMNNRSAAPESAPLVRTNEQDKMGIPLGDPDGPADLDGGSVKSGLASFFDGLRNRDPLAQAATGEDIQRASLTPETTAEEITLGGPAADARAAELAQQRAVELLTRQDLTDTERAQVAAAAGDPADTNNQQRMLELRAKFKVSDRMAAEQEQATAKGRAAVEEMAGADRADDDLQRSDVRTKASQNKLAVADTLKKLLREAKGDNWGTEAHLTENAQNIAALIPFAEQDGSLSDKARDYLHSLLGADAGTLLAKMRDTVGGSKSPKARENFFELVNDLNERSTVSGDLRKTVAEAAPNLSPDEVQDFVEAYRQHSDEELTSKLLPQEAKAKKYAIDKELETVFGDKVTSVVAAFAADAKVRNRLKGLGSKADKPSTVGADAAYEGAEAQDADTQSEDATFEERDADVDYVGLKKNGPKKTRGKPTLIRNAAAHTAAYGEGESAQERLVREHHDSEALQVEPWDDGSTPAEGRMWKDLSADERKTRMDDLWMPAKEYAKREGISAAQLKEMTGGKPGEFGVVAVRKPKTFDQEKLTWADVDAMRMNLRKGRRETSESIFEVPGTDVTLDAVKMVSLMQERLGYSNEDNANAMHRLRRAFQEAVGAVSDHFGMQVGDSKNLSEYDGLVIANRNGKKLTWALVKSRAEAVDKSPQGMELQALYKEREAAKKAGLTETVSEIDEAIQDIVDKHNDEYNEIGPGPKVERPNVTSRLHDHKVGKVDGGVDASKPLRRLAESMRSLLVGLSGSESGPKTEGLLQRLAVAAKPKDADWAAAAKEILAKMDTVQKHVDGATEAVKRDRRAEWKALREIKRALDNKDLNQLDALYQVWDGRVDALAPAVSKEDSALGLSEYPHDGNIHLAEAEHGRAGNENALGDVLAKSRNTTAEGAPKHSGHGKLRYIAEGDRKEFQKTGSLVTEVGRAALQTKINSYKDDGKSVAERESQRASIAKAKFLMGRFDMLSAKDQEAFAKIVEFKGLESVAGTIDGLFKRYGNLPDPQAYPAKTPALSRAAFVKQASDKEGHKAVIERIQKSEDAKGIQAGLFALTDKKHPNEYLTKVIAAANDRIRELLAKDESVAYELQLKTDAKKAAALYREDVAKEARGALDAYAKEAGITPDKLLAMYEDALNSFEAKKDEGGQELLGQGAYLRQQATTYIESRLSLPKDSMRGLDGIYSAINGEEQFSRISKGNTLSTPAQRAEVDAYFKQVLNNYVDVAHKNLTFAGLFKKQSKEDLAKGVKHLVAVSVHAFNPLSVAYHESLHAFAQHLRENGNAAVMAALQKAADSPIVRRQLEKLLKGETAALKQLNSQEERIAYMYQFWMMRDANGKRMLNLGDAGRTTMEKIFDAIKRVMGMWTNNERAEHIMMLFQSGEYAKMMGDQNAVAKAMLEQGRNKMLDRLVEASKPLIGLADAFAGIGSARLRETGNPVLIKIADLGAKPGYRTGDDAGFIPTARVEYSTRMNKLAAALDKYSEDDVAAAYSHGLAKTTPANADQTAALAVIRQALDDAFLYMKDAGVEVNDLGFNKDYLPVMWDPAKVAANQAAVLAMLDHYVKSGQMKGDPKALLARLMRTGGSELDLPEMSEPGMQHLKERVLKFITPADKDPYLVKDPYQVIDSYMRQATRRAEWSRRFGADKDKVKSIVAEAVKKYPNDQAKLDEIRIAAEERYMGENSKLDEMLRVAEEEYGASPEDIKLARRYVTSVNGHLGSDISPMNRNIQSNIMVYQNLRLLSLGLFSSFIDANGIKVNGGTWGEAYGAFARGVKDFRRNFKDGIPRDDAYKLAEDVGVIANAILQHRLANAAGGMTTASPLARKVNEKLFKYNGMEQWTTSVRVGATEAAMGFLTRNAKGDANEHSMRRLAELGLVPGDIVVKNGRPLVRVEEFVANGMKQKQAEAASAKMMLAINQWVDGAVLRPTAATKAIWMSDPHWAIFAHMKQFMFTFHETTLKRVAHEAKFGNMQPAVALMAYVPVMLAADLLKGMLQGGGEQPEWKEGWDVSDHLAYSFQRAGLFGTSQFGIDIIKDFKQGGYGVDAAFGPTVNQLTDAISLVGGSKEFTSFAEQSLPASSLLAGYLPIHK